MHQANAPVPPPQAAPPQVAPVPPPPVPPPQAAPAPPPPVPPPVPPSQAAPAPPPVPPPQAAPVPPPQVAPTPPPLVPPPQAAPVPPPVPPPQAAPAPPPQAAPASPPPPHPVPPLQAAPAPAPPPPVSPPQAAPAPPPPAAPARIARANPKSLRKWKPPPFSYSDVYEANFFSKCVNLFKCVCSDKYVYVEKKVETLNGGYKNFPLLSDNLRKTCPEKFDWLHVGMIQVALKPNVIDPTIAAEATVCVRDRSCSDFEKSLFAMVESSLSAGPIYFSYFPRSKSRFVSLKGDLTNTLCIDVNSQECSTLIYRIYYGAVTFQGDERSKGSSHYCVDETGETTLYLTTIARNNISLTSKKVSWDEVAVPQEWAAWKETAAAYVLKVDVPDGLRQEDVEVKVEGDSIVTVIGERCMTQMNEINGVSTPVYLGPDIKFGRRFELPENFDPRRRNVKREMKNGVLTVTVDKEVPRNGPVVSVIENIATANQVNNP